MRSAGTNLPRPFSVGKRSTRRPAHPGRLLDTRIRHGGFAFEALPRNAGDGVHAGAHLGEDLARVRVTPVEPQAPPQFIQQPEVLLRIAGGSIAFRPSLHHAIRVGDGADLLGPRGCCQHDIREVRGLGEEDVLHDQMIERRERLARVVDVGSDIAGFSPMMYIARISWFFAAFMIRRPSARDPIERGSSTASRTAVRACGAFTRW